MSPVSALLTARQWLVEERVEAVLFGAVDELCPVLAYCYDQFFETAAGGPIEPFAWDRQSAVMGEGAAFLLLVRGDRIRPAHGWIDRIAWKERDILLFPPYHPRSDEPKGKKERPLFLVLGADGHACCAPHYRRLAETGASRVAYTPLYGSLPGGQAFDIAIAALAAEQGLGPAQICSLKCDAQGNWGVIECDFNPGQSPL
jgi:3-oxoacyl-[acyl-carrier-protein] synthase II